MLTNITMYILKIILWVLEIFVAYTVCIKEFLYHEASCGDGHRPISNNVSIINVESVDTCSVICSTEDECQSFNIIKVKNNKYKYLCELKATWDEDICSSEMLESDNGTVFFTLVKKKTTVQVYFVSTFWLTT